MNIRRGFWTTAALLAVSISAGCSNPVPVQSVPAAPASESPAGPTLPTRPVELRLDGIDPCQLLTAEQRARFGLGPGSRGDGTDRLGSTDCVWPNSTLPPYGGPLARLIVKQGAGYYLSSTQPTQVIDISGFAAVQTSGANADPEHSCLVLVDAAAGQTLWTQYSNEVPASPGIINHDSACSKAREGAQAMITTLRAQLRK